jgi:hypothetical protein
MMQEKAQRPLDERRSEVAEHIAAGMRDGRNGGPNLKAAHLRLIDGFVDALAADVIADWKERTAAEWDKINAEVRPKAKVTDIRLRRADFFKRLNRARPDLFVEAKAKPVEEVVVEEVVVEAQPQPKLRGHEECPGCGAKNPQAQEHSKSRGGLMVAPDVRQQVMARLNPAKNPYNQNSFENARVVLEAMQLDCGLDLFHGKVLIRGKYAWLGGEGFEDLDNVVMKLRGVILDEFHFDPKLVGVHDALRERCINHAYNPLLDYLDSLEWDEKPRLDHWLAQYANADDTELNQAFGRKTLIAAIRRARRPGVKHDHMTVMEGKQGIGKSTLIKIIAGGDDYFSDKPIIGVDAREVQESVQGVWFLEIADLEGMHKADLSWIKAFLSRTHDKARPAFGRNVVNRPRQMIIWGTTNPETYLRDTTGNRRTWPVRCNGKIDLDRIARDRDQLLAEAVVAEALGESLFLPERLWEAAAVQQAARMEVDGWLEPISDQLANLELRKIDLEGKFWSSYANEQCGKEFRVSSAYLLGDVLGIAESARDQRDMKRLADVMRTLGWQLATDPIKVGKKTCRAYTKPHPKPAR